jgi:hypothetical protein
MKKSFTLFVLISSCYGLSAQNTGYAGKHFILKTDALNGRFLGGRNAELEIAFARRFTLTAGYRHQSGSYKQILNARDVSYITNHEYGYIGSYDEGIKNLPNATIVTNTVKIGMKAFFSRVIAAPKGTFFYASFETGKASVSNTVQLLAVNNSGGSSVDYFTYTKGPDLVDIKVKQYEMGFGYQEVLFGFLTIEGSMAFNLARFNGNGGTSQKYTTAIASYYGPNLLPFGKNTGKYRLDSGTKPHEGAFGLAAYIKVGFLLF